MTIPRAGQIGTRQDFRIYSNPLRTELLLTGPISAHVEKVILLKGRRRLYL